jgi:hypothetical protein
MKYIISENQVDKIKSKIHEYVKKYGFEKSREIFGDKVLLTIGFNNDPMEFLNLFNDLDVVQSEEDLDLILLRHRKGDNLMIYNTQSEYIYIDYEKIWVVLEEYFRFGFYETQQLTEKWLIETYNLIGTTTYIGDRSKLEGWLRSTI